MVSLANKRSMMILYSDPSDMFSHQIRIVLSEKNVAHEILNVDKKKKPEDLAELNPYNSVPVLLDRELVLYQPRIIMEYLDERFPHPPLLPVYPVARAKFRLMIYRIERDWFDLLRDIDEKPKAKTLRKRKELVDSIVSMGPVFAEKPYFFSDEFTIVDCCLAPFFWRLPSFGMEIPKTAKAIINYQKRVFDRSSFQEGLSDAEREMRPDLE